MLCFGAVLTAASPLLASESGRCGNTPREQWLPETAIKAKVAELGYEVRKIESAKGCYEVKGTDKNGAKIELYVHPATGAVVKPATERKDKS
jgi:hypothetical protein